MNHWQNKETSIQVTNHKKGTTWWQNVLIAGKKLNRNNRLLVLSWQIEIIKYRAFPQHPSIYVNLGFLSMNLESQQSWWRTGGPGVLQSVALQRVRHDRATELNWVLAGLKNNWRLWILLLNVSLQRHLRILCLKPVNIMLGLLV